MAQAVDGVAAGGLAVGALKAAAGLSSVRWRKKLLRALTFAVRRCILRSLHGA
jgi:hypothetical protein